MSKATKKRPQIVAHRPVIKQYTIIEYPPCMANISSPEAVRYRIGPVRQRYERREEQTGMPTLQCGNVATFQIEDQWYCKKHAAAIALEMLAVPVEEI